ncbi:Glyceraldehyde-3-phosphate dehydrogenase 3 [Thiorhodovibrio winogradskyi]|uniref:Glyceraldehyde-3-phosphate dehydrogenase 3 n=1 Tax=Thiorhodovibrio winogradskyi TaxID=77007 RepID=A0ABZ0S4Q8_9GAMM
MHRPRRRDSIKSRRSASPGRRLFLLWFNLFLEMRPITNTQRIVDLGHKDPRRARACGQSLIPTTGSARAITKIFPELTGKLNGHAVRVPLLNASLTDFVFEAERKVTAEDINALLKNAAEGELAGILGYYAWYDNEWGYANRLVDIAIMLAHSL